ncbi:hypothetical protein DBV14_14935 [Variovorax sp. KBW07]|nr:hypothetical protein DBV14_14935 [Variovorax sp. KBW07]
MKAALFLIASFACSVSISAPGGTQTWRCGSTYSDHACDGGKPVKVDDNRSDNDRRAADAGTRSASARADQLEHNRLSQEKAAYDRDRQAAQEARNAALADRRMALSEQMARAQESRAARDPRKPGMSFKGTAKDAGEGSAPKKKRKRKSSADSSAG